MVPEYGGTNLYGFMFFRRERPHHFTFQERMDSLRKTGFTITQAGRRGSGQPGGICGGPARRERQHPHGGTSGGAHRRGDRSAGGWRVSEILPHARRKEAAGPGRRPEGPSRFRGRPEGGGWVSRACTTSRSERFPRCTNTTASRIATAACPSGFGSNGYFFGGCCLRICSKYCST